MDRATTDYMSSPTNPKDNRDYVYWMTEDNHNRVYKHTMTRENCLLILSGMKEYD